MQSGTLQVELPEGTVELTAGDVLTIPIDSLRSFANRDDVAAEAYFVRGGDQPKPATL
jgi:mannose-6-phosphate isomerase-like protein (cupin superfamily)